MKTIDPSNGELAAEYEPMRAEDVARIADAAATAQSSWARTSFATRRAAVGRLADAIDARREELAVLMATEMGKPVAQGRAEVDKCAWVCRHYAEHAEEMLADKAIESGRSASYVAYRPLGVVLAVMPWNFPLWQVFRFLAPALMAGNGGLLKHASNVTGSALAIEELTREAGLPDDLFRTLVIPSSSVADVIDHPAVVAVTLTGSDPAGRAVASRAGSMLKKTVLELGGSDPYVIFEDADIAKAVKACATSRLINGGQSCIAAKRFIVHESIAGEFTAGLVAAMEAEVVGDPRDEATTVGPMARIDLRDELHDQVARSIAAGAKVELGGAIPEGSGAFYPPTILSGVTPQMAVFREETFGPVASVTTFTTEAEAIALANDTEFGLGAAVFTEDLERGHRIATEEIQAGACFINSFVASDPRLPFGGIKNSGYGRELSSEGMLEFVNVKTVVAE